MCGITCRPRLRQRLSRGKNESIFVAVICLVLMVTSVRGGSLDSSAAPTNSASAMWTLNDIYDVLNTRTTNVTKRTGGFTEPAGEPTNGTMHTLDEIMTLVTNRAPLPKTGQTNTYAVDDDGANRIGVAWPNPRFTVGTGTVVNTTNCVTDNLTGLMWARNANLAKNAAFNPDWSSVAGTCTWAQAFDVITNSAGPVNGANYGGYSDWRMPNLREMHSIVTLQYCAPSLSDETGTNKWTENHPFTGVKSENYWANTTSASDVTKAWIVYLKSGSMYVMSKTALTQYVWPVRGGR